MNAPFTPAKQGRAASALQRWRRPVMISVPLLLLVVGALWWLLGGRYVSTDNAYVHQDLVAIGSDVAGRIAEVRVRENEHVTGGQVLFELDAAPYRIALANAEANVAKQRLQVEQLRAAYHDAEARLRAAQQEVDFRRREYERQSRLAEGGYAAKAHIDEVQHALENAQQQLQIANQGIESARAALGGNPDITTEDHPLVREAVAARDRAQLDLEHTVIHAPSEGVVSQTDRLQVGQYVAVGDPVLSLVESHRSWVEANFKETELGGIRPGQKAEIKIEAYPGLRLQAEVESIGAGTGSEFSLLPAENATGNWVKVVQRVPVRMHILTPTKMPLRAGLSATVTVDTGRERGLFGRAFAGGEGDANSAE